MTIILDGTTGITTPAISTTDLGITGNLLVGTTTAPTGTGKVSAASGYTAPNNSSGAGTTLNILGSTGTGASGATGGNGHIALVGGGGTSSWTTFTTTTRRGGILLQAGLSPVDAGATYYSGGRVEIVGSDGTTDGTSSGVGTSIQLAAGRTTSTNYSNNNGGILTVGGGSNTSAGSLTFNGGTSNSNATPGGNIILTGGQALQAAAGGNVTITGGYSSLSSGGIVTVRGGASSTGNGSDVVLWGGNKYTTGSFVDGKIIFKNTTLGDFAQFDGSGNFMVGTATPYAVAGGGTTRTTVALSANARTQLAVSNQDAGSSASAAVVLGSYGADWIIENGSTAKNSNALTFAYSTAERMRLDATGNLLVGMTLTGLQNANGWDFNRNAQAYCNHASGTGSGTGYFLFGYNAAAIGQIYQSGTTAVVYSTTSDYRLKTVIGPVVDAGTRIDALEPVEYEWKTDGSRTRGFLAHQFQEVYMGSVSGKKDDVDEDGKPKYQAMQASSSEVIADLVAELQSLRKRITALETK